MKVVGQSALLIRIVRRIRLALEINALILVLEIADKTLSAKLLIIYHVVIVCQAIKAIHTDSVLLYEMNVSNFLFLKILSLLFLLFLKSYLSFIHSISQNSQIQ